MSIQQISVFAENKPGTMKTLTDVLAANNIDMRALSLAEAEEFGIVRIITDNVYEAVTALKDAGFIYSITPVLGVAIPDEPGGLTQVLNVLYQADVNVEYMYAFLGRKRANSAYMILRVQDDDVAVAVLKAAGIRFVDQEEIAQI